MTSSQNSIKKENIRKINPILGSKLQATIYSLLIVTSKATNSKNLRRFNDISNVETATKNFRELFSNLKSVSLAQG
jgi:hypothetical protein